MELHEYTQSLTLEGRRNLDYRITIDEQITVVTKTENVVCHNHIHRGMEIVLVTKGCLHMTIGDAEYEIGAGCAAYTEPYEAHGYESHEDNTCVILEFAPEFVPFFRDRILSHTAADRVIRLREVCYAYLSAHLPDGDRVLPDAVLAHALLSVLVCEFDDLCGFTERVGKRSDVLMQALDIIYKELDRNLSLSDVANRVGIRPETLSRMFSANSRMTYLEYVQYLRVYRAAQYLDRGSSCTEAAWSAGFGSICSFNRVFRKIMGISPSEYRRQENTVFSMELL